MPCFGRIFVLFILSMLTLMNLSKGNTDSTLIMHRSDIKKAYNSMNKDQLLSLQNKLEGVLKHDSTKWLVHYYLGLINMYRALINFVNDPGQTTAENQKLISYGISELDKCKKLSPDFSEAYVLSAYLYGFLISLDPLKGTVLNAHISDNLQHAKLLENNNPRIYLVLGMNYYFTPPAYGGNIDSAKIYLQKAVELFNTYQLIDPAYPDWGYEETYAWLGQIALAQDSVKQAESYYHKALEIYPEYAWVEYSLLPALQQKTKKDYGHLLSYLIVIAVITVVSALMYFLMKKYVLKK